MPAVDPPDAPPEPTVRRLCRRSVRRAGDVGSCTAGLRVDTGTYKVVYFAFGFEAINSAADRQAVMERVLNWLKPSLPRLYLPLVFAQLPTAGSFWAEHYRLRPGECTTLHWSVTNVRAVYLDDRGWPAGYTTGMSGGHPHVCLAREQRAERRSIV